MADKRPIVTSGTLSELPNSDALVAGQGAVLSEQVSSLGTPTSGYGVIYAKTDGKVYFKNDGGTEYDLTATGGSGTNPVIREYIANDTWTKPTASNFWGALIICIGAGSGGGSGRRGALSTARGGGSGGAGGSFVTRLIRSATLRLSSYAITIGTGSTGGAAQTVNNTNGFGTTNGGDTSFGALMVAKGGLSANGGTTFSVSGAVGSSVANNAPSYGPYGLTGATGGAGSATGVGGAGGIGLSGSSAGAAGGGAGAISTGNSGFNGGAGGSIYDAGVTFSGGTGGIPTALNGGDGSDVANNLIYDINNATTNAMGTGGGGGYPGDNGGTIAGGNGGNGGKCAGGGGGGGSTNGANSGRGGNGGNGLCFVVEYYGA